MTARPSWSAAGAPEVVSAFVGGALASWGDRFRGRSHYRVARPRVRAPGRRRSRPRVDGGLDPRARERALVGTGVSIALPDGYVAFVVPRSGLAAKHGITIVNAPGTVDAGYRGEIKVSLLNTDATHGYDVAVGDRIAQLIVMPVSRARFIPMDELPASARGEGGFGSTGYQTGERA